MNSFSQVDKSSCSSSKVSENSLNNELTASEKTFQPSFKGKCYGCNGKIKEIVYVQSWKGFRLEDKSWFKGGWYFFCSECAEKLGLKPNRVRKIVKIAKKEEVCKHEC